MPLAAPWITALSCCTLGLGCAFSVPTMLGNQPWPCPDGGPCPTGMTCIDLVCQSVSATSGSAGGPSSTGAGTSGGRQGSSAGTSGGVASTSGGTSGANSTSAGGGSSGGELLPPGSPCDAGSSCASGSCLTNCCESPCDTSDPTCGLGVYCGADKGECHYPATPCDQSCNPASTPEELTEGTCTDGVCGPTTTTPCQGDTPVCRDDGTACVPCYAVRATKCPATTCCDPSGACVAASGMACAACVLPTRPCTPNATGPAACCTGTCCPDTSEDGGYCSVAGACIAPGG